MSQAEIAKALQLQPSTVLRITADFIQEELIVQMGLGKSNSKGGRRATLLELNKEGAFAVGVDLNSEEIIAVIMNFVGAVVGEIRKPCPSDRGSVKVMEVLKEAIQELLASHSSSVGKIVGIGVSVPGKVNSHEGMSLYAVNFKDWHNVPIARKLEEDFQLPVYIEHDMRSMAFGEMWFGKAHGNMLCLGLRDGVGLGLVLNGELYRGSNQAAGDFGHVIVEPDGPQCSCGRKGCLETLASEKAILKKVRDYARREQLSSIEGIAVDEVDISVIYGAFKRGDHMIVKFVQEAANYLGRALCDQARVLDPQIIVIGGHILASSHEFLQMVRSTFTSMQPNYADFVPKIESAAFGEKSIAIGSASQIMSRLFKPNMKPA
jgi:predicted NBD/HSP70 family sugar kinase